MPRHFHIARDSRRSMRPVPDVGGVFIRCRESRKRRRLQPLDDYVHSFNGSPVLTVLLSADNMREVRWRLALILSDDGHIENTAWLETPSRETCMALAGLLTIQSSLEEPMDNAIDADMPLHFEVYNELTLEQALGMVIDLARDWAERLEAACMEGEDIFAEFETSVAQITTACKELNAIVQSKSVYKMNQAVELVSCT